MKINMTHPKEFYIKIIVILFIILMAVLIFVKFNTDNNSTQITEEQKKELFSKIEKNTNAKVTKFASYGTHFNLEGNIEIKPAYNKGKKEEACKYCEYKSICCFNPNVNNYSFIDNKSKKELLDNLQ